MIPTLPLSPCLNEDTFNNVFKKDLIEATSMKAWRMLHF